MRLKVGVDPGHITRQYEVYLDGERVPYCVEADEEQGYVICIPEGEHNWKKKFPYEPKLVRREGKVELRQVYRRS